MEQSGTHATKHGVVTDTALPQLSNRHDAVLPRGDPCDPQIGLGEFPVHGTYKSPKAPKSPPGFADYGRRSRCERTVGVPASGV